jgi:hypothetical protein
MAAHDAAISPGTRIVAASTPKNSAGVTPDKVPPVPSLAVLTGFRRLDPPVGAPAALTAARPKTTRAWHPRRGVP